MAKVRADERLICRTAHSGGIAVLLAETVTVNLLAGFDSEAEARGYECELLTALQPIANRYRSRYTAEALARYSDPTVVPPDRLARVLTYAKQG